MKWLLDCIVYLLVVPFEAPMIHKREDMGFWDWVAYIFIGVPLAISIFWFFPVMIVLWIIQAVSE